MFIYITGDCHGDYRRFSTEIFPEQYTMGKSDYVIVCGDFGYWSEVYISNKLTISHGQSDHLSRRFRSLISERYSR